MIRIYAERQDGSDTWEVFGGAQFLCRALAMEVGNVWRFLDDEDNSRGAYYVYVKRLSE